jgi:hypothetical protein
MTVGTLLARNHNVLAKACLGGGFSFGFLYTNKTGTSPIRTLASRAGLENDKQHTTFTIRTRNSNTG